MAEIEKIALFTAAAGACIPLGGILAKIEHLQPGWLEREFRHAVIAFGGGVLLAAVALVLVPEGLRRVTTPAAALLLVMGGGLFFFWLEWLLGLRRRETPQFLAMLLDFVPESLALGGMFAAGAGSAPLLAVLIGLQNLPEGFNAYRELRAVSRTKPKSILLLMCALVPVGPVLGILGWMFFPQHTFLLGAIMLFAAGGILYLIFQDIAPQSHLEHHRAPPLGAVLGFCVGIGGFLLVQA